MRDLLESKSKIIFQSFMVLVLDLILSLFIGSAFSKELSSEVTTLNFILIAICFLASEIWFAAASIINEIKKQRKYFYIY
jgi:hypothetical protein